MDWGNAEARAELLQRVGVAEYTRLQERHHQDAYVAFVAGHRIKRIHTQFGVMFQVGSTSSVFPHIDQATSFASKNPAPARIFHTEQAAREHGYTEQDGTFVGTEGEAMVRAPRGAALVTGEFEDQGAGKRRYTILRMRG